MRSFEFADGRTFRRIPLAEVAQTRISVSVSAPSCPQCCMRMLLVRMFRDRPGFERRTYECLWCQHKIMENRPIATTDTRGETRDEGDWR
jgi:hypothetical protein